MLGIVSRSSSPDEDPADVAAVHAWTYRRYVLASLPASYTPRRTPQDELRYTQKKIEANFSNFSAWHCRTKILEGLWTQLDAAEVAQQKDAGGSCHTNRADRG